MKKNQKGNVAVWVLIGLMAFGVLASALSGDAVEVPQQITDMQKSQSEIASTTGYALQGIWILGAIIVGGGILFLAAMSGGGS